MNDNQTRGLQRPVHSFDREAVRFARIAFVALGGLTIYTIFAYSQERFLTQIPPKSLELVEAAAGFFSDEVPELRVRAKDPKVVLSYRLRGPSMPDPVVILGDLEGLPKGWRIVNAIGSEISDGKPRKVSPQPVIDETDEKQPPKIYWSGLVGGKEYRLDLLLHPGESAVSAGEIVAMVKSRKAVAVKAYLKD